MKRTITLSVASALIATAFLASTNSAHAQSIVDGSFESPGVGTGNFAYNLSGSAWTFSSQSGVSSLVSGFTGGSFLSPPEGVQVGFLQDLGSISQSFTLATAYSNFIVSFAAQQRINYGVQNQVTKVYLDGGIVGTFTPSTGFFNSYSTTPTSLSAGSHTLMIQGDTSVGDHTAYIDTVSLSGVAAPEPASISLLALGGIFALKKRRKQI
jgi:hypothetical protein